MIGLKVYIVRHGEVLHNVLKRYSVLDEDLTENGMKQALELREKLKDISYDLIISSPLVRARHTADLINVHHKEILIDERLKERSCGDLSNQPLEVTNREEYWNYNTVIQYGTSENMKIFFHRIFTFLNELSNQDYESVLIVAHSGVTKAFSAYFNGLQDGFFLNRGLQNCEIKEYELERGDSFNEEDFV